MILYRCLFFCTILISLSRLYSVTANKMSGEISALNQTSTGYSGKFSVAFVTTPSEDVAKQLAHGLVGKQLAACVNIVPKITSIYRWEGKINEDSEALMMIKTKTSKVEELTEYVRTNHPYKICEVISLPIKSGNEPYLKWINGAVPGN